MKINLLKWCLLLGGSTIAALHLGGCIQTFATLGFDSLILASVN
jgi:hypothetical protein